MARTKYRKWKPGEAGSRRQVTDADYKIESVRYGCDRVIFRPTGDQIHWPKCLRPREAELQREYDVGERNSKRWWYTDDNGNWKL